MLIINKKAQSTLEYIIILTALVLVFLWAAASPIRTGVEQGIFKGAQNLVENASNDLPF